MKKNTKLLLLFLMIVTLVCGCSGAGEYNSAKDPSADYNVQGDEAADYNEDAMEYEDAGGDEVYEDAQMNAAPFQASADGVKKKQKANSAAGSNSNEKATGDDAGQSEAAQDAGKEKKEEKLVYTCNLTIETTEYKKTMDEITKQIKDFGGIIESQNEYDNDYGWYMDGHTKTSGTMQSTIVVKIPSKDYEAFLAALDGKGKMTARSMNVTNISRTYYDTQATIESLKIQEKRLLKMMDEAKTIEDMIRVEDRLTEVQTELNQYNTRLSVMDTEVAYSTITMDIKEVLEYKVEQPGKKTNTFFERLKNTFEESWTGFLSFLEGLLFLIIRLLPFIVIFGIVWIITKPVRLRFKAHRELSKAKREAKKKKKASQEPVSKPEDSAKKDSTQEKNTQEDTNPENSTKEDTI